MGDDAEMPLAAGVRVTKRGRAKARQAIAELGARAEAALSGSADLASILRDVKASGREFREAQALYEAGLPAAMKVLVDMREICQRLVAILEARAIRPVAPNS